MPRKDKTDCAVFRHLNNLEYTYEWDAYCNIPEVNEILSHAAKNGSGNPGYPDGIYANKEKRLLILVEIKPSLSQHASKDGRKNPEKYAVDGILHYLSCFLKDNIENPSTVTYFSCWKIIGVAVSGDIYDEYNHRISNFILSGDSITEQKGLNDILSETDYLMLFDNIDEEQIVSNITTSSKKINKWLRSVDSQKRPVLLSALMICLFEIKGTQNDFKNGYNSWSPETIVNNIPKTIKKVLSIEKLPEEKINVLLAELAFMEHEQDLNNLTILKDILNELSDTVIPFFERKSNYDIIGKFYEEFLKYAGVANVKKGIVLTPRHIATLFTELIDIKINDVFLDPACGTGSFLIAAMNKLVTVIENSDVQNKEEKIKSIKTRHLIGFEKNQTMYSLAISNMLFRGDGKSQIYNTDFFSQEAADALKELEQKGICPTIGFVNPPYGGKDSADNPTKKEIQFLTGMLDKVSRYGLIIAPLSTYFKDDSIRNNILKKHTLRYVINMPKDLFMPNAATNTAIAVFETHKPHGNQEVIFFDLKDDGYVLSKSKGRTDVYNKWPRIKNELLNKLAKPNEFSDGVNMVKTTLKAGDEWLIQAHAATDYSGLGDNAFLKSVKEYMIFKAKQDLDLLDKDLDEVTLLEVISNYYGGDMNE
ncbi:MAG: N-6 DNA methylase [Lachnospiraceae bacterium]|nr:N-6 DNA methylase [Lachnospiraceae bacterium]